MRTTYIYHTFGSVKRLYFQWFCRF